MGNYKTTNLSMEGNRQVRYSKTIGRDFAGTLNKRVRAYFKENNISRYANTEMKIKTVFMVCLLVIPLGFVLSGLIQSVWLVALMYFIMGLGTAGIGLSIMHDANHGAYSKKENVNKVLGRLLNLVGGFAPNWQIQHNVLHHTYTNVHGMDEDIMPPKILRFSPNEERKPIHRFQHLYAWFFYGLMTFSWVLTKDFQQYYRYKKMDLLKTVTDKPKALFVELIITKVIYATLYIVLPIIILDIAWWWIPIFVFMLHFVSGLILSMIFQPAHVVGDVEFVRVDESMTIENGFAIHQMNTTANFAPRSNILYWLIGGLNFQVEHHLFPNICHVHYKKISKIVRETAEEFGIPYHSHDTFAQALKHHTRLLKSLGRA